MDLRVSLVVDIRFELLLRNREKGKLLFIMNSGLQNKFKQIGENIEIIYCSFIFSQFIELVFKMALNRYF